jgi:hypothetical protein
VDVEKLIGEVAARNGIRIEPDDPAFALVTLNQLILEEAVRNLVGEIRAATADFESAAERVQTRAGAMLASEIGESARRLQAFEPRANNSPRLAAIWFISGVICETVLLLTATWLGWQLGR